MGEIIESYMNGHFPEAFIGERLRRAVKLGMQ